MKQYEIKYLHSIYANMNDRHLASSVYYYSQLCDTEEKSRGRKAGSDGEWLQIGLFIISERHENWKLVDCMQKCEGITVTFLNTMHDIMVQLGKKKKSYDPHEVAWI